MFDPPKTAPRKRPGSKAGGKEGSTAPKGKSAAAVREEGRRRRKLHDPRFFEDVKRGTREEVIDKEANVRIVVERRLDGLYYWSIETLDGLTACEGVHQPKTKYHEEFTAEGCIDATSEIAIRELEEEVKVVKKEAEKRPSVTHPVRREIIVIVKGDWLTKISYKRWGTFEWRRYLKPTQRTIDKRKEKGEHFDFDEDLIYPGDTFEVIA